MEKVEEKVEEKKENIYKPKVDNPLQRSIWVSNLSPMVSFLIFLNLFQLTESQLHEFFQYCGEIQEMKMEL
jgi:RNA recognition motif-containing protein